MEAVVVCTALVALFAAAAWLKRATHNQEWAAAARELGLEFKPALLGKSRIKGQLGAYDVRIETFEKARRDSDDNETWTRVVVSGRGKKKVPPAIALKPEVSCM